MRAVDRMAQARIAGARGILGPALAVHRIEFVGLADVVAERAGQHDVAVDAHFRMRGLELLDDLHRDMRDAAQMLGLVAALEHQHVRIAFARHVADALVGRAGERERPAFDHLGAQLGILDVVDLGQVLDDRGAQRIGDRAPLDRRCSAHVVLRPVLVSEDRIGSPGPVNSDGRLCRHACSAGSAIAGTVAVRASSCVSSRRTPARRTPRSCKPRGPPRSAARRTAGSSRRT